MKFSQAVFALATATAATTTTTAFSMSAFRGTGRGFLGRALTHHHNQQIHTMAKICSNNNFVTKAKLSRTSTTTMLLGNLFGGGGAFGQKIDYTALPFPGNELGHAAEQGEVLVTSPQKPHLQVATFAGGCFWGLELAYQRVPGVEYTAVGYCQGPEEFPTYEQVCSGATGHTEAVIVYYNPQETTYEKLLDTFCDRVNMSTVNGQGNDFGKQYRTGVYYHTNEQEEIAKARFEQEQQTKYGKKQIATELEKAKPFWPAEKYHQQYLEKGGRFGTPQDASKGATDTIRCYG